MKYLYFDGYSKLRVMIIFVWNMGLLIVNKLFLFISPIIPTLYAHPISATVEVDCEWDNPLQWYHKEERTTVDIKEPKAGDVGQKV